MFDFLGTLTRSDGDIVDWINDPDTGPAPRTGAPELVTLYHEWGLSMLYVSSAPEGMELGGMPYPEAVVGWLDRNGFPSGDSTARMWTPPNRDGEFQPLPMLTQELIQIGLGDGSLWAGYTDNSDKVEAMLVGGVPRDRMFTLDDAAGAHRSMELPDSDFEAHAAEVAALRSSCTGEN